MRTTTPKHRTSPRSRQGLLIVGIVVLAVVVVAVGAIALSGKSDTGELNFASLPQSRQPDGGFVVGNPQAPVTIVEFSDFVCPHCQEYHPIITQYLTDYVATGKAKFEFRVFPTAGGQLSYYTGQLLQCAEDQKAGSFWKGYELMFNYATSGRYTQDVGRLLANDEGLNYADLLSCAGTAQQVQTDINFGAASGITGTPAVMVRYNDGTAQYISFNNRTYNSGGVPYAVLAAITDAMQS